MKCICGAVHESTPYRWSSRKNRSERSIPSFAQRKRSGPVVLLSSEPESEFGQLMTHYTSLTRLAQIKLGYTPVPSRPKTASVAIVPERSQDTVHEQVLNLLRQRRMSETAINLWLHTPHKAFGGQVPGGLIADGRGEEILRLLDDAYHLRQATPAR